VQEPLLVRFLPYESAEEVRLHAALANIRAGHGTELDAAKLFREKGLSYAETKAWLQREGVPLRKAISSSGMALADLAPAIFQEAVTGKMPLNKAIALGEAGLTNEQQIKAKNEPAFAKMSIEKVREFLRFVEDAGYVTRQRDPGQTVIIIDEQEEVALFPVKASLSAWIKKRLKGDRRVLRDIKDKASAERMKELGVVVDADAARAAGLNLELMQTEELYDRLSTRGGPISAALDSAARRMALRENENAVRKDLYEAVKQALRDTFKRPDAQRPAPLRPDDKRGVPATPEGAPEEEVGPTDTELEAAGQEGLFGAPGPEPAPAPKPYRTEWKI
jgi:hypothetical protein